MILILTQRFYERFTGEAHEVAVLFREHSIYEVRVDGEFYATAENKVQAFDEVADIARLNNWTAICPM